MLRFQLSVGSVLGIFLGMIANTALASPCSEALGSCDYYQCREQVAPCGDSGYYKKFAFPYCSQLTQVVKPKLSLRGSQWMDRAAQCLRTRLDKVPFETSCAAVQKLAVFSHTPCYVETGFCKISFQDKWKIFGQIYGELKNPQMVRVFFQIISKCQTGACG